MTVGMRVMWAALFVLCAGCDDGTVDVAGSASGDGSATEADSESSLWLGVDDDRRPGTWLAEMDVGAQQLKPADAVVYASLLSRAGVYYHETPRMIANRMAQLYHEVGGQEGDVTIRQLLEDFAWRAGNERNQTLGEVAQHYLVLRRDGATHAGAMGDLRHAYGADGG